MRTILLAAIMSGAALPAAAQPAPQPTREWALRQLQNFVDTWSRDEGVTRAAVERLYAPRAVYYGKNMSREAIYADKRAYIARWPHRHYEIAPGSAKVTCVGGNRVCRATAVMLWTRADRNGRKVSGASRLAFVVTRASAGKIVRESAVTLR